MHSVKVTTQMNSDAATIWKVLDDFGSVYKYNPSVESSELLNAKKTGVGAARQCNFYDGTGLKEKISHNEPGRSDTFDLYDFPMPLKKATSHFEVTPISGNQST